MTDIDDLKTVFNAGSLYEVLGVTNDASQDEIKRAYLRRCREWHPDKIIDPEEKDASARKFHVLKKAYQTLCDKNTRNQYDESYSCTQKDYMDSTLRCDTISIYQTREVDDYYCYDCRCSGLFKLAKLSLVPHARDSTPDIFIVECDSCSEMIKIVTTR